MEQALVDLLDGKESSSIHPVKTNSKKSADTQKKDKDTNDMEDERSPDADTENATVKRLRQYLVDKRAETRTNSENASLLFESEGYIDGDWVFVFLSVIRCQCSMENQPFWRQHSGTIVHALAHALHTNPPVRAYFVAHCSACTLLLHSTLSNNRNRPSRIDHFDLLPLVLLSSSHTLRDSCSDMATSLCSSLCPVSPRSFVGGQPTSSVIERVLTQLISLCGIVIAVFFHM
jgi:hypothetical protein